MPYLFLSARRDDLNFARLVKIRLEDEGRTTWLDQGVEFVSSTGSLNRIEVDVPVGADPRVCPCISPLAYGEGAGVRFVGA